MGLFLESEKPKQAAFKANYPGLPDPARLDGIYKGKPRSFCFPLEHAEQNLFPGIRLAALDHFANLRIKWHDGQNGKPIIPLRSASTANFFFRSGT
jgi:hypothetical protein